MATRCWCPIRAASPASSIRASATRSISSGPRWSRSSRRSAPRRPNKPFYVTGHSKGGAVTYLAAMRLRTAYPAKFPVFVATFAAARAGNDLFAQAYDAAIPHSARFEYADDLVPHLPPSDAFIEMFKRVDFFAPTLNGLTPGYASVGDLHFIDWDGNLVGDSNLLEFHRFTHLAELMVGFGFQTIADDHSIAPGAGYDKGVP
ncbi:MAG: hypothetical protein WDN69_37820 [Aliidongia sp.]